MLPSPPLRPAEFHAAAADGLDRRAGRRAIIRAEVRPVDFQDRMEAGFAEMRGDGRREFQRRSKEGFLQRFAVRGVIRRVALIVVEQERLIFFAVVVVFGGQNAAVAGSFAVRVFLFLENDAESVALAGVGVEIEIVTEDLRQAHGHFGGFADIFDGVEERIFQAAADCADFQMRGDRFHFCGKAFRCGHNVEHAVGIDFVIDLPQFAATERPTTKVLPARNCRRLKARCAAAVASPASCEVRPKRSSAAAKFSPEGNFFEVGKTTCERMRSASARAWTT